MLNLNETELNKINAFFESGRIPHGFILCGGDDKTHNTAIYISMLLLCLSSAEKPCGKCESCVKVQNSVYPDLIRVRQRMPDEKYKIELLREVILEGNRRPNDGILNIFVFENSDEMSVLCQNTLLKFIEEPLEFNRFIFTAKTTSNILPTILSRLVKIDFLPSSSIYEEDLTFTAVKDIINALSNKNEYETASAFSRLKGREEQKKALQLLSGIIRDSLVYKNGSGFFEGCYREGATMLSKKTGTKNLISALEDIEKFSLNLEFNPNTNLAAMVYACGIFEDITER